MLAKVVNDNAGNLTPRSALRFFASKLAPTGVGKNKTAWRCCIGRMMGTDAATPGSKKCGSGFLARAM
ncbi:hypothetical protein BZ163_17790 [Pseudomonas sp. VI4.1]|nr:hypothetical protein BZ163_17790 [Pseudomonas sp. VI4.1]